MLSWLAHEGPLSEKHQGWRHPIVSFLVHYVVVAASTLTVHDTMLTTSIDRNVVECQATSSVPQQRQRTVAVYLAMYFCLYFALRLALQYRDDRSLLYVEFYRQTFLCSVTIFSAAFGFYTGRPLIAEAFCVAVGIDQLLWYDILF